jgi:hypothetical protein
VRSPLRIVKYENREWGSSSSPALQANAVFVGTDKPAIMTAIDIPSIGCWEITAQYGGDSLSFVVSVQP